MKGLYIVRPHASLDLDKVSAVFYSIEFGSEYNIYTVYVVVDGVYVVVDGVKVMIDDFEDEKKAILLVNELTDKVAKEVLNG